MIESVDNGRIAPQGTRMTSRRLLLGCVTAVAIAAIAGCGSSPNAPTALIAALALSEPNPVAWSAPAAGGTCAAGSVSDYVWTDTISETGGVQVTLTSLVVTIDAVMNAPTAMSRTIPANNQTALSRELCFSVTSSHTVTSRYSGTDANGHSITGSNTITLAAKPAPPITQSEISQLATAIGTANRPVLNALVTLVFGLTSTGTSTLDTTQPCQDGGTAHGFGPITITMDAAGTSGSIALDTSLVYAHCTIGGSVLDGGPLEVKGQLNVVASTIQNPVQFTITGSHTFVVDGVTGSVAFGCNSSLTIDLHTFTPTAFIATGNASLQYPIGQNPTTAPCQTFANAFGFVSGQAR
jgi:hypothetical protein